LKPERPTDTVACASGERTQLATDLAPSKLDACQALQFDFVSIHRQFAIFWLSAQGISQA